MVLIIELIVLSSAYLYKKKILNSYLTYIPPNSTIYGMHSETVKR